MNTIKDDAISRHGALNALCAVCGKGCDKGKFVYNAPQDDQVILCPEHYCLCALPSAQQWISCSERLPEEDTEVLISYRYKEGEGDTDHVNIDITSYGTVCFGGREIHTLKEWRQPFDYFHANYEVIAWMPLPEPYKGGL